MEMAAQELRTRQAQRPRLIIEKFEVFSRKVADQQVRHERTFHDGDIE